MPHDKNGLVITAGDEVLMRFVVRGVSPGEDYCNLTLESVEPLWPGNSKTTLSAVNAKQVEKVYGAGS